MLVKIQTPEQGHWPLALALTTAVYESKARSDPPVLPPGLLGVPWIPTKAEAAGAQLFFGISRPPRPHAAAALIFES
jgi:hypothetical protein